MTIVQIFWLMLATLWFAMELFIAGRSRQQAMRNNTERYSEYAIWLVVVIAVILAINVKQRQLAPLPLTREIGQIIGVIVFAFGLGLRSYVINYLGRFFSSRVEIQPAHRLITSGPYRYLRHPSYTGLLIGFTGAGLAMGDMVSMLLLLIPLGCVLAIRIRLEESLLLQHFGHEYEVYQKRSKKLIPGFF